MGLRSSFSAAARARAALAAISVAALAACGADSTSDDAFEPGGDAAPADAEPASDGARADADAGGDDDADDGGAPAVDASPADAAVAVDAPGCGAAHAPGNGPLSMMSGGRQRDAIVHVPTGYTGAAPVPLVVVMHGYTETDDQIRVVSGFDAAADANGLLVVYPQGTDLSWNAGKCCGNAPKNGVDDVGYVRDLIDRMNQDYCVDPKRVFATGFSNGGMLSNRLACELSDRIAAIGPVAGPLAMDTCSPSRPVPVIEFHGTADPVVWWGGAPLSGTPAVETNVANWAKRDGCTDPSGTQVYAQGDVTCTRWSQCAGGSAVELCKVNDGGHQWPGGQSAGPFGKLTQDVDATARMVEFFLAHGM